MKRASPRAAERKQTIAINHGKNCRYRFTEKQTDVEAETQGASENTEPTKEEESKDTSPEDASTEPEIKE